MEVKIEKGIPAPNKPTRKEQLPFEKLEVGDSFVVDLSGYQSWAYVFSAIQHAQSKHNIKLTTKLVEPTKRRVWRTA